MGWDQVLVIVLAIAGMVGYFNHKAEKNSEEFKVFREMWVAESRAFHKQWAEESAAFHKEWAAESKDFHARLYALEREKKSS